ncbi:MAG: sulfatase, partial [Flavobacteriaceae bacterium]|nr:sulfatase [Flavobacteriaceae bacterium]
MFYRIQEYKILFFRVFLAYLFYSLARVLFYFYNKNIIIIDSFSEFFNLFLIGLTFDTSAILYVNSLFILISLIPIKNNSRPIFQKGMFVLYFSTNITAYVTNYVDFIYYKFSQSRLTTTVFDLLENETNKLDLMSSFIVDYWHVFLIFIISVVLWIYLYNSITFKSNESPKNFKYYGFSLFWSLIIIFISIVGMRGGLGNATRPINMVDAHRFVKKGIHADFVLNSPFCLIRTYKK